MNEKSHIYGLSFTLKIYLLFNNNLLQGTIGADIGLYTGLPIYSALPFHTITETYSFHFLFNFIQIHVWIFIWARLLYKWYFLPNSMTTMLFCADWNEEMLEKKLCKPLNSSYSLFDRSQTNRDVFVTCQKARRIPQGVRTHHALTLCTFGIQRLILLIGAFKNYWIFLSQFFQ